MGYDFPSGAGSTGGPISPDAWKRAVYRSAPTFFCVEMLPPAKLGGAFSYGMRVCPIKEDGASISSKGSNTEYEVWRRWEDCLWFQETIELEYNRMAREKRNRLLAGKGVKKNGIYIHSDEASSFDSLPPGPDPNSIARDLHEFVPKLTKKGTLFRASQATIDQRYQELVAFVDGLFQEDPPTLLKELRSTRTVTDFFGFWRRDHDLAMKQKEHIRNKPRNSISSSVFSLYFSPSSPAVGDKFKDLLPSPTSSTSTFFNSPTTSPCSASQVVYRRPSDASLMPPMAGLREPSSAPAKFSAQSSRHSFSEDSQSFTSSTSSGSSRDRKGSLPSSFPSPTSAPVIVSQEVPIMFGHNPHYSMESPQGDRPTSVLESLPEDGELPASYSETKGSADLPPSFRRGRRSSNSDTNRNFQVFVRPGENDLEGPTGASRNSLARYSWQTTASGISSYLDGLDVTLPTSPLESSFRPMRASIASVASCMSDVSAVDAVMPRPAHPITRRSLVIDPRRPRPMSVPEEEEDWFARDEDILDTYLQESTDQKFPTSDRPETPLGHTPSSLSSSENLPIYFSQRASMITVTSVSTNSTSSSVEGSLTVKAAFNDSIIVLRIARATSLSAIRQKLHEKFAGQEGVPLSDAFGLFYVVPNRRNETGQGRSRSSSVSSSTSAGCEPTQMRRVSTQREWEEVIESSGSGKLTLRIYEP